MMPSRHTNASVTRRHVLVTGGLTALGAAGLRSEVTAQSVRLSDEERANIQVIDDFVAAWNAKDATKVMAFFTDDARFAVGPIGKTPAFRKPDFVKFIQDAKSLKMTVTPGSTWARGPVVTHERTDEIVNTAGSRNPSGVFIAVFALRDRKIVDFIDFLVRRT